jgi:hypothetical protein
MTREFASVGFGDPVPAGSDGIRVPVEAAASNTSELNE